MSRFTRFSRGNIWFDDIGPCKRFDILQLWEPPHAKQNLPTGAQCRCSTVCIGFPYWLLLGGDIGLDIDRTRSRPRKSVQVKQRIFDKGNAEGNDPPHLMLLTKAGTDNALYNDNYNEDNADDVESVPYLAALAGMNSIVEP